MNKSHLVILLVACSSSFRLTSAFVEVAPQANRVAKNSRIIREQRPLFILRSTKRNSDDASSKVSKELVDALDLYPMMESVAKHAGTKRGRDSLLSLVKYDEVQKKSEFVANYNNSRRKDMLTSMAGGSTFSGQKGTSMRYDTRHIIKVAESLDEAQSEWMLIEEATRVLNGHEKRQSSKKKKTSLPLPPIYGESSSPWTISNEADSDDDEWLVSITNGFSGPMELENILQAEQVVTRIIGSHAWAQNSQISTRAPTLSEIFRGIDLDVLNQVYEEIAGTVVIRKGNKSLSDPSGSKVCRLKFPGGISRKSLL